MRNVIVTGSRGDIGRAICSHLAAKGWRVAGVDRSDPAPEGGEALFVQCDLTDRASCDAAIDDLVNRSGPLHALINCAGLIANAPAVSFIDGKLTGHDPRTWEAVIAANLTAPFNACVAAARHMIDGRTKGVLVNFGSVAARGNPGQVAYSAAKAGIEGMTRTLARELSAFGIRAVCVAPGFFDTPSTRRNVPEAKLKSLASTTAPRRLGRLEELASAIDFILSDEYFNGSVLELDGGLVL